MDIKEFLRDKDASFEADEKFIKYLEELKDEAKTAEEKEQDSSVRISDYLEELKRADRISLRFDGKSHNEEEIKSLEKMIEEAKMEGISEDELVIEIHEYKFPIRRSFIKKYPGFSARLSYIQTDIDGLKEFVYKELNRLNISESELANRCNLHKQTLNKILNRQCFPNKKTLLALCVGLKCTPEEAKYILQLVGYTFNYSDVSELIVYTALDLKEYNIDNINRYIYEAGYNGFIGSKVNGDVFIDDDISDLADETFVNIADLLENGCNSYEELVRKTGLTEGQARKVLDEIMVRKKERNAGYSTAIIQVALNLTIHNIDVGIITNACGISLEQYNEIIDNYMKKE